MKEAEGSAQTEAPPTMIVVLNGTEELKHLVPTK